MNEKQKWLLKKAKTLHTFRSGDRRAPHKPLLLLIAIANLKKGVKQISFDNVRKELEPLLNAYAPPVKSRHQPELPYWHLCADGIWEVFPKREIQYQKGGFPTISSLRKTFGSLTNEVAQTLESDPGFYDIVVTNILSDYFPPSIHEELLDQIGYVIDEEQAQIEDDPGLYQTLKTRDSNFRRSVLRAYEYECVVTGFRAALSGSFFGCEAAHVQWHAYHGPDKVCNGIALEPTMHKLFDAGAWSLTDDRRVLVSAEYTGSPAAIERLRNYHGMPIKSPIPGEDPVSLEFIKWHRSSRLGGVFRGPALALD